MPADPLPPIVLLGPTAGGKSEFAVALAEALDFPGEVIGADSMQVYREMDAGTAKPSRRLREHVPHHLIDCVEPTEPFSVADWLKRAEAIIDDLQARGRRAIVVGGTNLYLKALLEGMFEGPGADDAFRKSLEPLTTEALHARLGEVDADAADRIHLHDRKRIVRALEVHHVTGEPISRRQKQWCEQTSGGRELRYGYGAQLVGLRWPVDAINARINQRVKAMFFPEKVEPELAEEICPHGETLVDETRRLLEAGRLGTQAGEALGYKQVLAHLRGEMTLDEAFEQTKIQTRRFAKQQRTWLKRYLGVRWYDMPRPIEAIVSDARASLAEQ